MSHEGNRAARKISDRTIMEREWAAVESALTSRGFGGYIFDIENLTPRAVFGPAWLVDVFDNAVKQASPWEGMPVAHYVGLALDLMPHDDKVALDTLSRLSAPLDLTSSEVDELQRKLAAAVQVPLDILMGKAPK